MAKEFLKNFSRILQEFQKRCLKEEEATGYWNTIIIRLQTLTR
jgi:hypothetical protein